MVTYDMVREMALALPNGEEGTSYWHPALKVRGKLFVRLKEDGETIVLKTTYEEREELIPTTPKPTSSRPLFELPVYFGEFGPRPSDGLREMIRVSYNLAKPRRKAKR